MWYVCVYACAVCGVVWCDVMGWGVVGCMVVVVYVCVCVCGGNSGSRDRQAVWSFAVNMNARGLRYVEFYFGAAF